jgi:hypothetical protein
MSRGTKPGAYLNLGVHVLRQLEIFNRVAHEMDQDIFGELFWREGKVVVVARSCGEGRGCAWRQGWWFEPGA